LSKDSDKMMSGATLRLELLKIGVQVIASVRRIVLRLPQAFPFRDGWRALALRSGASPGCGRRSTFGPARITSRQKPEE
jgi:hypothetical protein